jgi:hypothetical protein
MKLHFVLNRDSKLLMMTGIQLHEKYHTLMNSKMRYFSLTAKFESSMTIVMQVYA